MSLNLPDHITLPQNPGRHNTAIAEIVVWSLVWTSGIVIGSLQDWYYWDHRKSRNVFRCILHGWIRNLIVLLAQVRIIGFAMYLAIPNAAKGTVITEVVLQGVGVSPLVLQLSLVMLKCDRIGLHDQKNAHHYDRLVRLALQWTRLPIVTAVILIIVAGIIINTALIKAGATIILATFVLLLVIIGYMFVMGSVARLPKNGQYAIWLIVAALPFYVVRLVYMMLADFSHGFKYSPAVGDWKLMVGLGFVMEIVIVCFLTAAMLVAQPILGQAPRIQANALEVKVHDPHREQLV